MACGLWKETLALAEDYLSLCCSSSCPAPPPPSEWAAAMRSLAQDMEKQHQARFQSLAHSFLGQCGPDPCSSLRKVMEELVGDGRLNWGRVVSLFTFTGVLARLMQEQESTKPGPDPGQEQQPGQVPGTCRGLAETIADYLGEEKKDWLLENGGWVSWSDMSERMKTPKRWCLFTLPDRMRVWMYPKESRKLPYKIKAGDERSTCWNPPQPLFTSCMCLFSHFDSFIFLLEVVLLVPQGSQQEDGRRPVAPRPLPSWGAGERSSVLFQEIRMRSSFQQVEPLSCFFSPTNPSLLFPWQEAFSKFSLATREVSHDSSMKTALFAAAGLGLAGLTFLLVR